MTQRYYPRVELIPMEGNILDAHQGKYITKIAHEILASIGIANLAPTQPRLEMVTAWLCALYFETVNQYDSQVDLRRPDTGEHQVVEEARLADGNKAPPQPTSKPTGRKR